MEYTSVSTKFMHDSWGTFGYTVYIYIHTQNLKFSRLQGPKHSSPNICCHLLYLEVTTAPPTRSITMAAAPVEPHGYVDFLQC